MGINAAAAAFSSFHGVASRCLLTGLMAYSYVEEDSTAWEMILSSAPIKAMELLSLPDALLICSVLLSMMLQLTLHMREGIPAPIAHCYTRFNIAIQRSCLVDCDG